MQTRHLRAVFAFALLIVCVHAGGALMARVWPESGHSVRLLVLLAISKMSGDLLLGSLRRAPQPTVYYQDFLIDWLRFGVLAAAGTLFHAAATRLVDSPVSPGPVAFGVYLIHRLMFRVS
jgi:hypothetical protein